MDSGQLSELFTLISLIAGGFAFMYSEVKSFRADVKHDFSEVRANRKAEIEQSKVEIVAAISEAKLSFKADLSQSRQDVKSDINELKVFAREDMAQMRADIIRLSEAVSRLDGTLAFLKKDDHPVYHPRKD